MSTREIAQPNYGLSKADRIGKLLSGVAEGKTAEEAYAGLIPHSNSEGHRKAQESFANVAAALGDRSVLAVLKTVVSVKINPIHNDSKGFPTDGVVQVIPPLKSPIQWVKLQVFSSSAGENVYRHHVAETEGLTSDEAVDTWLKQDKTVVVNGQVPPDQIRESFFGQLKEIHKFFSFR